ncbi:MAG TPA: AmmeMemoRadiSam system protein B, partial [Candidatus Krumholzibacteria bacterium]|nr:AmmeMemoRadiSam system protein B [Candidatus Krumholzibacteria bacterium]
MTSVSQIREPAVAGFFYPSAPAELATTVDTLLAPAHDTPAGVTRVLLAPHAGYPYSGAVAGAGFSRLRASHPRATRAFIIGPSHVEAFAYTSVFGGSAYRTPLGDVPVDADIARTLARESASIRVAEAGHVLPGRGRGEHAIEVELPFLQRTFPAMHIVPIVMGVQSWPACEELGQAIERVADWTTDVIIASSDLSHFYDDRRARELDSVFCETFLTLDAS